MQVNISNPYQCPWKSTTHHNFELLYFFRIILYSTYYKHIRLYV